MLAKHSMLFASLTTTQKAVVENPEQRLDIHRPSNTPVTDRVQFTCRKPGESILDVGET